jgi:putative hemolysin
MICVAHDTSINEIIDVIKTHGHTRIPVYMETIDQIQGIINAKDLLPFISDTKKNIDILKLGRPAIFVPESKKIDDLLKLFQKERQHMAIVVDEYGGTSGIVTLEDVIEEIVGEIRDEYDQEQTLFRKIDDNTFIVNAKIDVDSLNKLIDLKIPMRDEYETLGGFILELTGSVPNEKDVISHGEYEFVMQRVEKNRIVLVRISRKPELIRNSERSQ